MRRPFLARMAILATAAAALGMLLVPARAEAADHQPDGCGHPDSDIGSDAVTSATAPGVGSILDGWANRDMDIDSFGSAMTQGVGSILDGWANRDMDIGAFASDVTGPSAGSRVDGRANRDVDSGAPCS
jgi:hypothetical protein